MTITEFITEMFSSNGKVSHKRVITFLAFALIAVNFQIHAFYPIAISPELLDVFKWIIIAGMGTTVADKFVELKTKPKTDAKID